MSAYPRTTGSTSASRFPVAPPLSTASSYVDVDRLYGPLLTPELHDGTTHPLSTYTLGTRKSNLAHIQTHLVAASLSLLHPSATFTVESMSTVGDRNQMTPLHLLTPYSQQQPAKALWTDELEARLMSGHFDVLVHSLKDVPTTLKEGCEIGCMLEREDPRDALVVKEGKGWQRLDELPEGRRVAQLKRAFPGLRFEDMVSRGSRIVVFSCS